MKDRKVLWLLLALALIRGLFFASLTPAFQAPDEMTHAAYIEVVATQLRLPLITDPLPPIVNNYLKHSGWWDEWRADTGYDGPEELTISAAAHPPLYYLLAAPVFQLTFRFGDAVWLFALRLLSVLMATWAVYFAYRAAEVAFPKDTFMQVGVPLFIIVLPQLGFITSSVNNDALLVTCGAALVYGLARFIEKPEERYAALVIGLSMGAGLLTKPGFLIVAPAAILCILTVWYLKRPDIKSVVSQGAIMGASSLVLGGWWYAMNMLTAGYPLPGKLAPVTGTVIGKNALAWAIDIEFIKKIVVTFWADFGWLSILIDKIGYVLVSSAAVVALAGFVLVAARPRLRRSLTRGRIILLGFCLVAMASAYVGTAQFDIATQGGGQGRYMFVAIVPLAMLLIYGVRGYLTPRTEKTGLVVLGLTGSLFTFVCAAFYIMPFYYG